MNRLIVLVFGLVVPVALPVARADELAPLFERGGTFGVGLDLATKVGAGFHQPFGPFGATVVTELEVGWLLPLPAPVGRGLEVFFASAYQGPRATGSTPVDPRLAGDGTASYAIRHHQAVLSLGVRYRLRLPVAWLAPHASLAARSYLARAVVTGEAAQQPFGTNRELTATWGLDGALGVDFLLGPGAILLEFGVGWAPLDDYVLQSTSTGSLTIVTGYRFFL